MRVGHPEHFGASATGSREPLMPQIAISKECTDAELQLAWHLWSEVLDKLSLCGSLMVWAYSAGFMDNNWNKWDSHSEIWLLLPGDVALYTIRIDVEDGCFIANEPLSKAKQHRHAWSVPACDPRFIELIGRGLLDQQNYSSENFHPFRFEDGNGYPLEPHTIGESITNNILKHDSWVIYYDYR